MAEAVWLQRVVGPDQVPTQNPHFPTSPSALSLPALPGPESSPQPQSLGLYKPGKGAPGSGEAAALQEVRCVCVCACASVLVCVWRPCLRIVQALGEALQ